MMQDYPKSLGPEAVVGFSSVSGAVSFPLRTLTLALALTLTLALTLVLTLTLTPTR